VVARLTPSRATHRALGGHYGWNIELLFKLWKSHNQLAQHRAGATEQEQLAVVYAKLIGTVVQHWVLLTATWAEGRRSLRKAATVLRDWITSLTDCLDDVERLAAVLNRIMPLLAGAQVDDRWKHPSLIQLLMNPELLDYET
jgi:hypothetical protein